MKHNRYSILATGLVLVMSFFGAQNAVSQSCNITVQTTDASCFGSSDGSAEIWYNGSLLVLNNGNNGGGTCSSSPSQTAQWDCGNQVGVSSEYSQNSGTVQISGGETVYLTSSAFVGNIQVEAGGGNLIVCGHADVGNFNVNETVLPLNVQVSDGAHLELGGLNFNPNVSFFNYGTIEANTSGYNGSLFNFKDITINGSLNMNSTAGTFLNEGSIHVTGAMNVNTTIDMISSGPVTVDGSFQINGGGSLQNNCEFLVKGAFAMNSSWTNAHTLTVLGASAFNSGTLSLLEGSLIDIKNVTVGASVVGPSSSCATFKTDGNTTIHSTMTGNISLCQQSGSFTLNGSLGPNVGQDCSCSASPGGGTSSGGTGVNGTVTWTIGVPLSGTSTAGQLAAGAYAVTVDLESCNPETISFTIGQPTPVQSSVVLENDLATVTASGGNGGYSYVWSDGITLNSNVRDFANASAGTYCVEVRDQKGCLSPSQCVTIEGEIQNPDTCLINVNYEANNEVTINASCPDCEWTVVADGSVLTQATFVRPCHDTTITLSNCEGETTSITVTGNSLVCLEDPCPDPNNPECDEQVCPNPLNSACCDNGNCCINTQGFTYVDGTNGTVTLVPGGGSGQFHTYNTVNSQHGLVLTDLPTGTMTVTVIDVVSQVRSCVEVMVTNGTTTTTVVTNNPQGCVHSISDYYLEGSQMISMAQPVSFFWYNPVNDELLSTDQSYDPSTKPLYKKPSDLRIEAIDANGVHSVGTFNIPVECYPLGCHPLDICDEVDPGFTVTYTATGGSCGTPSVVDLTVTGGVNNTFRTSNSYNNDQDLYIEGLPSGLNSIVVYDVTAQTSKVVDVYVPFLPVPSFSIVNVSSPFLGNNTGFSINVSGDNSGPYTIEMSHVAPYYLSNVQAVNGSLGSFTLPTDQGDGPFVVKVTDAYCRSYSFNTWVNQITCNIVNPFVPEVTQLLPTASYATDGFLILDNLPSGATATWSGGSLTSPQTGSTISSLGAGTYYLNVTSDQGCYVLTDYEVVLDYRCPYQLSYKTSSAVNDCVLEADVAAFDQAGNVLNIPVNLTYLWYNPYNGQIVASGFSIDVGLYDLAGNPDHLELRVLGACGQKVIVPISDECRNTVVCPGASLSYKPKSPSCHDSQDGQIMITGASGGYVVWLDPEVNAGERYSWNRTGLSSGTYPVLVFVPGCTNPARFEITLGAPAPLDVDYTETGSNEVTVSASNGTAPYSYLWSDESIARNSGVRGLLVPGQEYTVTIIDNKGCSDVLTFLHDPCSVNPPRAYTVEDEDANSVTVYVDGGVPDFTYVWTKSNGDLANKFGQVKVNLPVGLYTIEVTDSRGCTGIVTYGGPDCSDNLDQVNVVTSNSTHCDRCNGTAYMDLASFDANEFTVLWDNIDLDELLNRTDGLRAIRQNSQVSIINVCPGNHEVFVVREDVSTCGAVTRFTVDYDQCPPNDCQNNDLMVGDLSSVVFEKQCASDQTPIDILVSGGEMPYSYTWIHTPPTGQVAQFGSSQPGLTNAQAGSYELIVVDADLCDASTTFNVSGPETALSVVEDVDQPSCYGQQGIAEVTPSGGVSPHMITWFDGATDFIRSDLNVASTHTYQVIDAAGCSFAGSVTIDDVIVRNSFSSSDVEFCTDKPVDLSARYWSGYDILWSGPSGVVIEQPTADVISVNDPGIYTLTRNKVPADASCGAFVETITVIEKTDCEIIQNPCEVYSYTIPPQNLGDECSDFVDFNATATGVANYYEYLEALKLDFTNNYVSNVMSSTTESLVMSYSDKEQHYTLYYYDQAGNLVRTVPPAGVRTLDQAEANSAAAWRTNGGAEPDINTQHTLATTYTYNSLNQLVAQDVPDNDQQAVWGSNAAKTIGEDITSLMADGDEVWVFANSNDKAHLYSSTNGGQTYNDELNISAGDVLDMTLAGSSGSRFFAVGTQGMVLRSDNGGQTWQVMPSPSNVDLSAVWFADQQKGYVFTENGQVWRTTNAGNSWSTVGTGSLATLMSGSLINDIYVNAGNLFLTVNDGVEGKLLRSNSVSGVPGSMSFSEIAVNAPTFEAIAYNGTELTALSGDVLWKLESNGLSPDTKVSGISGTIQGMISNGSVHVVKTNAGVYSSINGITYTQTSLNPAATIFDEDGALLATYNNVLYEFDASGNPVVLKNLGGVFTSFASDGVVDYALVNNNQVHNINSGAVFNLSANSIWYAPAFGVDQGVVFVYSNNAIRAFKEDVTLVSGNVVSGGYKAIKQIGGQWYAVSNSNGLHAITITDALTAQIAVASIPTQTLTVDPLFGAKDFAFSDNANTAYYLDWNNKVMTSLGGAAVENELAPINMFATSVSSTGQFTTANDGLLLYLNGNGLDIELTNLDDDLIKASQGSGGGSVATSSTIYDVDASGNNLINAVVTSGSVIDMDGDLAVTTNGTIYRNGSASGQITGLNTGVNANGISIVGGDGTSLHYLQANTWIASDPLEVAPILDAAQSGTSIVAVGENGTIIRSTNGGSSFSVVQSPTSSDLTAVTNWGSGFALGTSTGQVWLFADAMNAEQATGVGSTSPVNDLEVDATGRLWALVGSSLCRNNSGVAFTSYLNASDDLNKITFVDNKHGYLIGNSGLAYRLLETGAEEDAGSQSTHAGNVGGNLTLWQVATDNNITDDQGSGVPPSNLRGVNFVDRYTGYLNSSGMISKTTDGGYHWVPQGSYQGETFLAYAGGDNVVTVDDQTLGTVDDRSMKFSSRFWYDELGRLVLSQSARQYNIENYLDEHQYQLATVPGTGRISAYSYTQYDDLGRITEAGELLTREPLQTYKYESQINYAYLLGTFLQDGTKVQLTKTYYDRVAYENLPENFTQENLRPRVASVTYQQYDGAQYDKATHFSYDVHGNVKSLLQEINRVEADHIGFNDAIAKRIDYDYDLISGNVNHVYFQRDQPDAFVHRYVYDGDNRIREVYTSRDEIIWTKEADYEFYAHGPLARVQIGQDVVEQCDYAYTIHGWVKDVTGINYSYSLGYYEDGSFKDYEDINGTGLASLPMSNSLFNGNISTMKSVTPGFADHGITPELTRQFEYDQLNRIKSSRSVGGSSADSYATNYDYDANGNIDFLERFNESGVQFDQMSYNYHNVDKGYLKNTNRLRWVDEDANASVLTTDIEDQSRDNYVYDENGNLIADLTEDIESIEWNANGKVQAIHRHVGSSKPDLYFAYDVLGKRISKKVLNQDGSSTSALYFRDGTGNVVNITEYNDVVMSKMEQHIYGSERLGLQLNDVGQLQNISTGLSKGSSTLGVKKYECSDHLKNIHVVVSDLLKSIDVDNDQNVDRYEVSIVSSQDFFPFGAVISSRSVSNDNYRYAFNGMEQDPQVQGVNESYSADFWQYDPYLAKRWNLDPVFKEYESPYSTFSNNPIWFIDPTGADTVEVSKKGEIKSHVKAKGDDYFVIVDKKGKRTNDFVTLKENSLESYRNQAATIYNRSTKKNELGSSDILKIRSDDEAKKLFEFLAENTNVEWGRYLTGIAGDKGLNFISTSHQAGSEHGSLDVFNGQLYGGYTVRGHVHSHPSKYNPKTKHPAFPSGLDGKGKGDIAFAKSVSDWYIKRYPNRAVNLKFQIYIPDTKVYINYSPKSKYKDFGIFKGNPYYTK